MLRKARKKPLSRNHKTTLDSEPPESEALFYKVTKTLNDAELQPENQRKMMTSLREEIKRPETSHAMKQDYRNLMNLVNCSGRIRHCRNKSMAALKKIRGIHDSTSSQNLYQPVKQQIRKSEAQAERRKHQQRGILQYEELEEQALKPGETPSVQETIEGVLGHVHFKRFLPLQSQINQKLALFGDIEEAEREKMLGDINALLIQEKASCTASSFSLDYQVYLIDHYVLKKFMQKVADDPHCFRLKEQNEQLYGSIKSEMIGKLVDDKKIKKMIRSIHRWEKDARNTAVKREQPSSCQVSRVKTRPQTHKQVRRVRQNVVETEEEKDPEPILFSWKEREIIKQFNFYYEHAYSKIETAEQSLYPEPTKSVRRYKDS